MVDFLANNLIKGKLKWATLEKSKAYSKYTDAVIAELDSRGYMIDENGNCVPKPVEEE